MKKFLLTTLKKILHIIISLLIAFILFVAMAILEDYGYLDGIKRSLSREEFEVIMWIISVLFIFLAVKLVSLKLGPFLGPIKDFELNKNKNLSKYLTLISMKGSPASWNTNSREGDLQVLNGLVWRCSNGEEIRLNSFIFSYNLKFQDDRDYSVAILSKDSDSKIGIVYAIDGSIDNVVKKSMKALLRMFYFYFVNGLGATFTRGVFIGAGQVFPGAGFAIWGLFGVLFISLFAELLPFGNEYLGAIAGIFYFWITAFPFIQAWFVSGAKYSEIYSD